MSKIHSFSTIVMWEGNTGTGTSGYRNYSRNHSVSAENKPGIPCSSDPLFRGDKTRYNPEELLIASLSGCHMLWYLHLCADAGVVVTDYSDKALGNMLEEDDGNGRFKEVVLYPVVTIKDKAMEQKAMELHAKAHHMCYIANSCNFPVINRPIIKISK